MKAKYLWFVLITLVFFGCDDNTGNLGLGMLPAEDEIVVGTKTFSFNTESQRFKDGRIYAKTDIGYVGRFTDNEFGFGRYEASYLTELNCVDNLTFPKPYNKDTHKSAFNMAGEPEDAITSVTIELGYYQFFGDSLTPMQVSAYKLNKNLEKGEDFYFTDVKPEDFYSKEDLLGKKTFSAVDLADSTRHQTNHLSMVSIPLDKKVGVDIVKRNWSNPDNFANSEAFKEYFKGIYVTSEIGSGVVLYVQYTQLVIRYKTFAVDSVGNTIKYHNSDADSTYDGSRLFASTMEVLQTNRIEVAEEIDEKLNEKDCTYLKSPAGIYTTAILPINDFFSKLDLEKDTINSVKLILDAYHHDKVNKYNMSAPQSVLLIKESEVENFFKKNTLPDNITSYVTDIFSNQYTFTNITRLVTTYIREMKEAEAEAEKNSKSWNAEQWLKDNPPVVAIVPVSVTRVTSNTATTINNVQHEIKPTYVKLKGGVDGPSLDLQVVFSKFK